MNNRRKLLFKINNEVVIEESNEMDALKIEEMKWVIVQECECAYDDIEVEFINLPQDISDIDVTSGGSMFNWRDVEFKDLTGVICSLEIGSDKYFDALANGTIEDYMKIV
jgi:hypothetical protein